MRESLLGIARNTEGDSRLANLPIEIIDLVADAPEETLMTHEQAEKYREQLMSERTAMAQANNVVMYTIEFNMCEQSRLDVFI